MQRAGGFKERLADARLSLIGTGEDWEHVHLWQSPAGTAKAWLMLSGGLSALSQCSQVSSDSFNSCAVSFSRAREAGSPLLIEWGNKIECKWIDANIFELVCIWWNGFLLCHLELALIFLNISLSYLHSSWLSHTSFPHLNHIPIVTYIHLLGSYSKIPRLGGLNTDSYCLTVLEAEVQNGNVHRVDVSWNFLLGLQMAIPCSREGSSVPSLCVCLCPSLLFL